MAMHDFKIKEAVNGTFKIRETDNKYNEQKHFCASTRKYL